MNSRSFRASATLTSRFQRQLIARRLARTKQKTALQRTPILANPKYRQAQGDCRDRQGEMCPKISETTVTRGWEHRHSQLHRQLHSLRQDRSGVDARDTAAFPRSKK